MERRDPSKRRLRLVDSASTVTFSTVQPSEGSELRNTSEPPGSVSTESAVADCAEIPVGGTASTVPTASAG